MKEFHEFTRDVHVAAWDYITRLSAGMAYIDANFGICRNVYYHLSPATEFGYEYCGQIFEAMGLNYDYPLGVAGKGMDKWEGIKGENRRHLAGQMASYIEEHFLC